MAQTASQTQDLKYRLGVSALIFALAACGGSKHKQDFENADMNSLDSEVNEDFLSNQLDGGVEDGGMTELSILPEISMEAPPPVTFVLKNTSDLPLVLSLDRGWQPVIFAYSGKPPKAESILMYPTHCTASCETEAIDRCPICEEPEKVKDVVAAEKHYSIEPGAELEVPWDGMIYNYEKTRGENERGRKTRCSCWSKGAAPDRSYTVKSCGLRLTQDAKKPSQYVCTEAQMTLPVESPMQVALEFQ